MKSLPTKRLLPLFWLGLLLGSFSLPAQYAGGSGDGHDAAPLAFTFSLYDPAALFAGGSGDGHDAAPLAFTLTAYNPTALFGGGSGDGHDALPLAFTLTAYDPTALFAGGSGDGHDALSLAVTLTAYDPTALFGGGSGDGHDMAELFAGALPLDLIVFSADAYDKYVLLRWTTTNEAGTDYFTVEKSRDGSGFRTVATLAAAGTSTPGEEIDYELQDAAPWTGASYYRLRTTDFDGSFSLSELRRVDYATAGDWDYRIFPNPNDGRQLGLRLTGTVPTEQVRIEVFDARGRLILEHQLTDPTGQEYDLPLPASGLTRGSYLLRLRSGNEAPRSKVLVVAQGQR